VTGDKKIRRSGEDDSYSQELAEYLNMMDETDRRLTPEHVAAKLGDLLDHAPPEKTPEDTPSSPGEDSTSGSLGLVLTTGAVAVASWYLARRRARKGQPQFHPKSFDPTPGRGEHTHLQDERL
jgi:hypothetical protein